MLLGEHPARRVLHYDHYDARLPHRGERLGHTRAAGVVDAHEQDHGPVIVLGLGGLDGEAVAVLRLLSEHVPI